DVVLADLAVHRVAVRVRGDHERVDRRRGKRPPIFPVRLLLLIIEAEERAHHRDRIAVHPVEADDERVFAAITRLVRGWDVETELARRRVEWGHDGATHHPCPALVRIDAALEVRREAVELARLFGLWLDVPVSTRDEARQPFV